MRKFYNEISKVVVSAPSFILYNVRTYEYAIKTQILFDNPFTFLTLKAGLHLLYNCCAAGDVGNLLDDVQLSRQISSCFSLLYG